MKDFTLLFIVFLCALSTAAKNNTITTVKTGEGEKQYVDMGLPSGTLWATMNVGANSLWQSGRAFTWGELHPGLNTKRVNGADMMTKYCNNPKYGYNNFVDNDLEINEGDDAAAWHWGREWRMPTKEQFEELLRECDWKPVSGGYVVISRHNQNSLYFGPSSASYIGIGSSVQYIWYWSRTADKSDCRFAFGLSVPTMQPLFGTLNPELEPLLRGQLCLVRPVYVGPKAAITNKSKHNEEASQSKVETQQTFTANGVSFTMIAVEGGGYTMGSPNDPQELLPIGSMPMHYVKLSSFYIGQTEVTQELWQAVMGNNPSNFIDPKRPVEKVSWYDCQEFCKKLTKLTGKIFRLPTEEEWEFAARGGVKSQGYLYSGGNILDEVACYNPGKGTLPVASKKANELGIYDMSGNVREWCQDLMIESYFESPEFYHRTKKTRVQRGGDWNNIFTLNYRLEWGPDLKMSSTGFRIVCDNTEMPKKETAASQMQDTTTLVKPVKQQEGDKLTFEIAKGLSFNMIYIEGGTFTMGPNLKWEDFINADCGPRHEVTLNSYCIGETEVTQALWVAVMGSNPSYFNGQRNRGKKIMNYGTNLQRPVETVSWDDCQEFIRRLNLLTGKQFRLPTEAEWEYAAHGGSKSQNYNFAGSDNIHDVAWYCINTDEVTQSVARKKPNELGLYDMSGNVFEWCQDWYDSNYYKSSPSTNPTGPSTGTYRVIRGGCCNLASNTCVVFIRQKSDPNQPYVNIGFRLAL